MKYIKEHNFVVFGIYRIILSIIFFAYLLQFKQVNYIKE